MKHWGGLAIYQECSIVHCDRGRLLSCESQVVTQVLGWVEISKMVVATERCHHAERWQFDIFSTLFGECPCYWAFFHGRVVVNSSGQGNQHHQSNQHQEGNQHQEENQGFRKLLPVNGNGQWPLVAPTHTWDLKTVFGSAFGTDWQLGTSLAFVQPQTGGHMGAWEQGIWGSCCRLWQLTRASKVSTSAWKCKGRNIWLRTGGGLDGILEWVGT